MKFHLSIAFPSIRHTLNFCEQDRESAIIELSLIKKIESLPFIIFTKIKARKWQILWQWLHKRKKHENVLAGISCSNQIFHNSAHQPLQHWHCENELSKCQRASSRTEKGTHLRKRIEKLEMLPPQMDLWIYIYQVDWVNCRVEGGGECFMEIWEFYWISWAQK